RHEPAQVAVPARRLLDDLHAPPRGAAPRVLAHAVLSHHGRRRGGGQPDGLRAGARPPVPRAQALVSAPLLRPRGHPGEPARAHPARPALRLVGRRRAGLRAARADELLGRRLPLPPARPSGRRGAGRAERVAAAPRQRGGRGLPLAHARERQVRDPPRDREPAHDRGTHPPGLGAATRAVMTPLDYIIVGAYLAGMLTIGAAVSRRIGGFRDFFVAAGHLTAPLLICSLVSTYYGLDVLFGGSE